MYMNVDGDALIDTDDIIGIFDMDNTTVSRQGRNFLPEAEKRGEIVNSVGNLPKAFILVSAEDRMRVYISSVSPKVLANRAKA